MRPSHEFKKFCLVFLTGILILSLSACSKGIVRNQSQPEEVQRTEVVYRRP